jgi:hypothetical protein
MYKISNVFNFYFEEERAVPDGLHAVADRDSRVSDGEFDEVGIIIYFLKQ